MWLKNKFISILSQGLTKSQWGEEHSETGREDKEKRATCHLNVGIKLILSSHFLKLMMEGLMLLFRRIKELAFCE